MKGCTVNAQTGEHILAPSHVTVIQVALRRLTKGNKVGWGFTEGGVAKIRGEGFACEGVRRDTRCIENAL